MKNVARQMEILEPVLEYCLVTDEHEGQWTVAAHAGRHKVKTAASCLMKPEKGDIVLVSIDYEGCSYILSILERPDRGKRPTVLSLEGQIDLQVPNGALRVSARDGIAFTTPERMAVASGELDIRALKGTASIERFSFLGRFFEGRVEKVKMIADTLDSVFRRAVQRFVSSYRYIEEHEEIQSASTRMLVDGTLTMQTKNTVHMAEGHVKIDAEQIHLG